MVAAAAIAWWPAFTLGAYGVIFFEQTLSLWAASTAIFLVSLTVGRRDRISWPQRSALLLPTVWLVAAIFATPGASGQSSSVLFWVIVVLTLVGIPYLALMLLRVTVTDYARLSPRSRIAALLIIAIVAGIAYGLGQINERFLTCEDFTISGNSAPEDCQRRG